MLATKQQEAGRPFVGNAVVATPTAIAHVHVAGILKAPLVLVSAQPILATRGFPHVYNDEAELSFRQPMELHVFLRL
jgi:hypothetical protein